MISINSSNDGILFNREDFKDAVWKKNSGLLQAHVKVYLQGNKSYEIFCNTNDEAKNLFEELIDKIKE